LYVQTNCEKKITFSNKDIVSSLCFWNANNSEKVKHEVCKAAHKEGKTHTYKKGNAVRGKTIKRKQLNKHI
jgi:hypothetical protein